MTLSVSKLTAYYGKIQVLWEVSIEVQAKEIVSLIGANGAGKSTLLKSIMGMVRPTGGSITYDGRSLIGMNLSERISAEIIANKYHLVFHYVQTGSLPNSLALLEKGQAQAMDFTVGSVAALVQAGKLRVIYNDTDALPSPWAEFGITATNSYIQNNGPTLKKINLALSETIRFILNNPSFAEGVVENFTQSNSQVGAYVYGVLQSSWNPSLSIGTQALSNVDNVYVQYGITPSASAASVTSIYTTQFLPS